MLEQLNLQPCLPVCPSAIRDTVSASNDCLGSNLFPQGFLPNTATQIAHWSFDDTLNDISANQVGPAVIVGSNTGLVFEDASGSQLKRGYIKIRNPGFLNVPNVNIQSESFTFAFSLRLAAASTARQILLSNWSSGQWQYLNVVDAAGTLSSTLRRNMETNGSNPEQDLVSVTTAKPVPVGTWFDVAFSYDTPTRTYSVHIDQQKSASSVVRSSVTDLTLHTSNVQYVQFGNKADDNSIGNLNADLRDLRFFKLHTSTP
jgi:Concanavalin A-like lectin/glucanases superfamily